MDYVSGVSLMRYMRETGTLYGQEEALMLMRPVLEAVGKLHKRGILHLDIQRNQTSECVRQKAER